MNIWDVYDLCEQLIADELVSIRLNKSNVVF